MQPRKQFNGLRRRALRRSTPSVSAGWGPVAYARATDLRRRWVARGRWAFPIAIAAVAIAQIGCDRTPPASIASEKKPNVILLTLESMRTDHVGCYGYDRDTTPALDRFAAEATVYENAYSVTSWTLTSHASIFTGLYPHAHQVLVHNQRLRDDYTTLAEVMHDGGYQTAGFISGPFLRKLHNLHQGFEIYEQSAAMLTNAQAHRDVTNPEIQQQLTRFLNEQRDPSPPFFLFSYVWDPHYDYIPPDPFDGMFVPVDAEPIDVRNYETANIVTPDISSGQLAYVISQYDGEIRWTDQMLDVLFTLLRDLELWDNTVIIVTSDHGEEFFDHGMKGHKTSVHEESVHVPLIVKYAGQKAGRRDARLVSLVDLFPTVVDSAGLQTDAPLAGLSLTESPAVSREIYFDLVADTVLPTKDGPPNVIKRRFFGVRRGQYKLLNDNRRNTALFDLETDPREQRPLGVENQQLANELATVLRAHRKSMRTLTERWGPPETVQFTNDELRRLAALGYIQGPPSDEVDDDEP